MATRTRLARKLSLLALLAGVACGGGGGGTTVTHVLTVTPPTNGSISLSPSGGTYAEGTVVTVTATPAGGFQFGGWTGALSGTTNPTTITMDADKTIGATFGPIVVAECDKAANVARRAALVAAQPALQVAATSGKTIRTFTTTFASVAGDPLVQCDVDLQFRDLSGDGALQPYEDWTRTAAERAADLAGRLSAAQRLALMAHMVTTDAPGSLTPALEPATAAAVDAGVRFGLTAANTADVRYRAAWSNTIQARCEAGPLGIPFVISSEPAHSSGNGRAKARSFSQWPSELGFGATGDLALVEQFGGWVAQEYRAIGVGMALSPSANLATEPRWFNSQFSFGEDSASASAMVGAFVRGLQGATLGQAGVAAVVGEFPGAGAAGGGWDARLVKGQLLAFSGTHFDEHVGAFQGAFAQGVAGVMPGYGVPGTGAWTGLSGLVTGGTIEQVGAAFNAELLDGVLRGQLGFGGLVVAPRGVLEDPGLSPLGAPWGLEASTRSQRIAKAAGAGVDQFVGLSGTADLSAAGLDAGRVLLAAERALTVTFRLGLFENPYVDPALAPARTNTDAAYKKGLDAMNRSLVLLVNKPKPANWLNGAGDGTQVGDKGNAGNGTLLVLPAPPGEPYVSPGCDYFVAGDFDLDYVNSVSAGYGNLTNNAPSVKGVPTPTDRDRMALSDYIFVRVAAPYTADPDSGGLGYALQPLTYAGNDPAVLAPVADARTAIDTWVGPPASRAQIVVFVDAGRPPVLAELTSATYGVSGLYVDWIGNYAANPLADKVVLDVAFGIVNGRGTLPVGLPASDAAAAAQLPDVAGDGQDATFVRGFGLQTNAF